MHDGTPRILIIRLSAIGDVVRALPILHLLRDAYPEARIDWAVEPKSADVLQGHPHLDELLLFDRAAESKQTRAFMDFCRTVRANRYDIVVDAHGIAKSGLITAFSGARKRVGFARPRARELSWLATNRKVRLDSPRLNRVEENLALCHALVPKVAYPPVTIPVPEDARAEVEGWYDEQFDADKRVIAVHAPIEPGRPEKQWPLDHYARLCDHLLADGRFEVVLTWGPGQLEVAQSVAAKARRYPRVAPEMPTLRHYAWFVSLASLYVGGDTGPMHVAWVMGTPVVALFGGTDPAKHAPYRPPFETLYVDDPVPGNPRTAAERLAAIEPEAAYDACVRVLSAAHRHAT